MQPADLYKLLYQAALGSEHAVEDPAAVRDILYQEIQALPERSDEPLLEIISPDGNMARVNLRPFIRAEGDLEALLQAFLSTASGYNGESSVLCSYLEFSLQSSKENRVPLEYSNLLNFFHKVEAQRYPAVHHSALYKRLYAPAYRVIHLPYYPALQDLQINL
jgi:hypothetical protein